MKEAKLSDLMPDYKFDVQELSQIKGGGPGEQSANPTDAKPPSVCNANLCQTNRDDHIGECSAASCVNQA